MGKKDFPTTWSTSPIVDAISFDGLISDGDWVESKDQDQAGLVRLIQLADIGDGEFRNKSDRFMTKESAAALNCTYLQEGDVLVARMPDPLGRACIFPDVGQQCVTVVDVCLIRTGDKSGISNKLLTYWINSPDLRDEIAANASGTTRKRITRKKLELFDIPIPPLAEQKVIADKLDTLLAQVDNTKARLERIPEILKSFRQSVLAAAVSGKLTEEWRIGKSQDQLPKLDERFVIAEEYFFEVPNEWKLTAIGNCATFQQGLQIAKATRRSETDDDVLPILRTVNYENNFIDDVHYALVDDKSIIAEPQDIIISRTGTVGRVLTGYRGIMHNNSFRINYDKQLILREYLIYFLKSPICQEYVKENSGRSTQPDLTHKAFAKCPLALPPVLEQCEIIRRVEKLFAIADRIEQAAQAAQSRVNNLTQSILAKAFRGELTLDWRAANLELISGDNSAEALLAKIKAERAKLSKKTKAKSMNA